jgi:hypothetical protein
VKLIPDNDETTRYVARFAGFCRDCADHHGICPTKGLPCDSDKAILFVIRALNYGFDHGFIQANRAALAEQKDRTNG